MSEESKNFTSSEIFGELISQSEYATRLLSLSRRALIDSNIGKDFNGKPPRAVIMHAVSRALTEVNMPNIDQKKLLRGLISLCISFLEDEDIRLAMRIKDELGKTDK